MHYDIASDKHHTKLLLQEAGQTSGAQKLQNHHVHFQWTTTLPFACLLDLPQIVYYVFIEMTNVFY